MFSGRIRRRTLIVMFLIAFTSIRRRRSCGDHQLSPVPSRVEQTSPHPRRTLEHPVIEQLEQSLIIKEDPTCRRSEEKHRKSNQFQPPAYQAVAVLVVERNGPGGKDTEGDCIDGAVKTRP